MVDKINQASSVIAPKILAFFQAMISFFEFFLVKPAPNAKAGVLRVGELARATGASVILSTLVIIFQFAAANVGLLNIPLDQQELITKVCFAVVMVLQIIMRMAQGSDQPEQSPEVK